MLRKRIDSLSARDGRYFLGGEPYSGVGFESKGGRFVDAFLIEKGEMVSAYRSPYFLTAEQPRQIDISGFTEDGLIGDEKAVLSNGEDLAYDLSQSSYDLFFQGKAYSGLAYEFLQGNCIAEFGYSDGNLASKARWDANGNPTILHLGRETIQDYEWYSSGALKRAQLRRITRVNGVVYPVFWGSFAFSEKGALTYLSVDKAFVSSVDKLSDLSPHSPVKSREDLHSLTGAEQLSLFGDGVDDEVFGKLSSGGVFRDTSELRVSKSSLRGTNIDIDSLVSNTRLKKLRFDSNKELDVEFVKALKQRQLDVDIR